MRGRRPRAPNGTRILLHAQAGRKFWCPRFFGEESLIARMAAQVHQTSALCRPLLKRPAHSKQPCKTALYQCNFDDRCQETTLIALPVGVGSQMESVLAWTRPYVLQAALPTDTGSLKFAHPVQDPANQRSLHLLCLGMPRMQLATAYSRVFKEGVLDSPLPVIAGLLLPFPPPHIFHFEHCFATRRER
ncbi:MAG: hypothetical protein ACI89E_001054 [Planctomycetota bacterium]|jgi:hypothetical protein